MKRVRGLGLHYFSVAAIITYRTSRSSVLGCLWLSPLPVLPTPPGMTSSPRLHLARSNLASRTELYQEGSPEAHPDHRTSGKVPMPDALHVSPSTQMPQPTATICVSDGHFPQEVPFSGTSGLFFLTPLLPRRAWHG